MPMRPPAGFISAFYDPLNNPNAPTIGTATAGDVSASVAFTPPSNVGGSAISLYGARSTPENITATAASSPISVTGLTNGTAYTFAVWAINTYGPSAFSGASNSVTPAPAPRALFAGGASTGGPAVASIDYVTIGTTGDATNFGDLLNTASGFMMGCCGSSTRSIFAGSAATTNVIQFVSINSTGNASDFGDLLFGAQTAAAFSSATIGVFAGNASSSTNIIQYITIATTGNAIDFGDLASAIGQNSGLASPTIGISAGGSSQNNIIQYVTIASAGNATNFGDLTVGRSFMAAAANSTRGLFMAGYRTSTDYTNIIDYITIASAGNATDFGDLALELNSACGASSSLRALCAGGFTGSFQNVISYFTISSPGNSTDFGDLSVVRSRMGGASNAHGGI